MSTTKRCIACAEDIHVEAKLCKHCKVEQSDKRFIDQYSGNSDPKISAQVEESKTESGSNRTVWIVVGITLVIAVFIAFLVGSSLSRGSVTAEVLKCGGGSYSKAEVQVFNSTEEPLAVDVHIGWFDESGTQVDDNWASLSVLPNSFTVGETSYGAKYLFSSCKVLEISSE